MQKGGKGSGDSEAGSNFIRQRLGYEENQSLVWAWGETVRISGLSSGRMAAVCAREGDLAVAPEFEKGWAFFSVSRGSITSLVQRNLETRRFHFRTRIYVG